MGCYFGSYMFCCGLWFAWGVVSWVIACLELLVVVVCGYCYGVALVWSWLFCCSLLGLILMFGGIVRLSLIVLCLLFDVKCLTLCVRRLVVVRFYVGFVWLLIIVSLRFV